MSDPPSAKKVITGTPVSSVSSPTARFARQGKSKTVIEPSGLSPQNFRSKNQLKTIKTDRTMLDQVLETVDKMHTIKDEMFEEAIEFVKNC
jgi:hypothetical protein